MAYWMLLTGMLPVGVVQLSGVPKLLTHYKQHQAEADAGSFWHFLLEHYSDTAHHGNRHDHSSLPLFQAASSSVACIIKVEIFVSFQARFQYAWAELPLPSYAVLLSAPLQPPRS